MDATQCGGATNCNSGKRCLTHDLWTELNEQVDSFLLNKSLQDVIKNKRTSLARKQEGLIVTG
jgi:Rrf2 family iron-sulfur cluster assembly transcriptional regulator